MKRFMLAATAAMALAGGGLVAAQTAGAKATDDHAAHQADKPAAANAPHTGAMNGGMMGDGGGMMNGGMMNGGMMGGGMMGGGGMMNGGMMGLCPAMLGGNAKVEVKKLAKGVTISITSDDSKVVARVQKMAEAMRLMHEANTQ